jgi:2-polyprenyl-3-methyl-5-hydroxy-6-metoxy-1,4-benzoquinol methylase
MGSYTALCTYLARREKIAALSELLGRHWSTLRSHGLVTDEPAVIYFGEDYSGPFFVEIMTWMDPSAPGKAYWIREVNEIWTDLYNFTEPRDGRPGIDYPTVKLQKTLTEIDVARTIPANGHSGAVWNWEEVYRSGRHLESWDLDQGSPELCSFLASYPPATVEAAALDLGCGSGSDCIVLAQAGYRTYGIDISAEALRIAGEKAATAGVNISFCQTSVLDLPFPSGSFSLVTDRGCFHHIPEEERDRYAEEVARVLKPGGKLLLRGCRIAQFPFVAITAESLTRHFPGSIFEIDEPVSIDLVTRSGMLAGLKSTICKRGGVSNGCS